MKLRLVITHVTSGTQYQFDTEELPVDCNGNADAEGSFELICDAFFEPNSRMYIYTNMSQVLPIEFVRNHCVISYQTME